MCNDTDIRDGVRAFVSAIDVPAAPLDAIFGATTEREPTTRPMRLLPLAAAACLALAIVVQPKVSLSFVQSFATRVAAILHWTPPPAAPHALLARMHAHEVSFDQARTMVRFHLAAPVSIPSDATLASITVIPAAHFASRTKTWALAPNAVLFDYKRRNGRSFQLMATATSAAPVPSKYMFVEVGTKPDGMPMLKRFERFFWRNGDQMISVTNDGISTAEIATIRAAMHGTAIPTEWPIKRREGATMYYLPKP